MPATVTAVVGATVIDGTGAKPRRDATVLLRGRQILALGPRRKVRVPPGATIIDGRRLFLLPGFIDAGVHLTRYLGSRDQRRDSVAVDSARNDALASARTKAAMRYGVTTVRDSRGMLPATRAVRESLHHDPGRGARVVMAGPSLGSVQGEWVGVGRDLIALDAESLRVRVGRYLDRGIDFLKYSGTVAAYDFAIPDAVNDSTAADEVQIAPLMLFSDRAQRAIVDEAHKRGLRVETRATSPDGLHTAVLAGVDVVQHPELMRDQVVLSDALIQLLVRHRVVCVLFPRVSAAGQDSYRQNARRLIANGCRVAVASGGSQPGLETLRAIEGLVTLGMSPMAALIAATRDGAYAANLSDEIGTLASGKVADLIMLRADPLQDIRNIEQIALVFREGVQVYAAPPGD